MLTLSNFFFLSLAEDFLIEHTKISAKFDNFNTGKARISFRITCTPSSKSSDLGFYLLIKNDEDPVTIEKIDPEYNTFLDVREFRQVAGTYAFETVQELDRCTVFTIGEFPENPGIKDRIAIHPKRIFCKRVDYEDTPRELKDKISTRDILLKIGIEGATEILQETSNVPENSCLWTFQFRIFLGHFVPEETLRFWESSSESWSIDFDIHKRRGYEYLISNLEQINVPRYPKSVELWFTIPHLHHFVASSPVYEKAFRLKFRDVKFKTERNQYETTKIGEFETQEGDYAVKIVNKTGDFAEFSIICISPLIPGGLKKEIEEFRSRAPFLVTWKDILTPFSLLVALISLTIGSTVALVTDVGVYGEKVTTPFGVFDLKLLILSSVFTGAAIWAIASSLSFATQYVSKRESKLRQKGVYIGPQEIGTAIAIIVMILYGITIFLLYFNQRQIYIGPKEFGIALALLVVVFHAMIILLIYFNEKLVRILKRKFGIMIIISIAILYVVIVSLLYFSLK